MRAIRAVFLPCTFYKRCSITGRLCSHEGVIHKFSLPPQSEDKRKQDQDLGCIRVGCAYLQSLEAICSD